MSPVKACIENPKSEMNIFYPSSQNLKFFLNNDRKSGNFFCQTSHIIKNI